MQVSRSTLNEATVMRRSQPCESQVRDFGAIGDGQKHPLIETSASLAAAQVDFPAATSLADQIDRSAFQATCSEQHTPGARSWPTSQKVGVNHVPSR